MLYSKARICQWICSSAAVQSQLCDKYTNTMLYSQPIIQFIFNLLQTDMYSNKQLIYYLELVQWTVLKPEGLLLK